MSTSASPSRSRTLLPNLPSMPGLARPRLTVVPGRAARGSRVPFAVLVVSVLALGLVGLLLLNTSMERGAYRVTSLRAENSALALRQQALQMQVAGLAQPQSVATKAARLGMVPDPGPAFLSLASGTVRGYSAPGLAGTQLNVGALSLPTIHRLGKIAPAIAGQRADGSMPPVTHRAPQPPGGGGSTGAGAGSGAHGGSKH